MCKSRFAVPCRVVYGSGGGVSSVCSSLESWSHGFFASELSREIVTVSLWESRPLVLKGGTRARDNGSGVVYLSRFSLGGGAFQFHGLPSVKMRVLASRRCGFVARLLPQVDWTSRVRRLNIFGSTKITLSSSLNCRDTAVQSSRVGWFTGLRYLCLEILVVSPALGGSYGVARVACFSVSRYGRSSRSSGISW
ncbi:hypothetical protein Bca52824_088310 [Brassica carinata]|uniref:Uncharacterized protein n=1 Tax=Brassica carinata TaxID=52824 RepID=A0A8X7PDE3_BRACI|nr:hypothetical protein Bca52824_088310 [Brassica carinata]